MGETGLDRPRLIGPKLPSMSAPHDTIREFGADPDGENVSE